MSRVSSIYRSRFIISPVNKTSAGGLSGDGKRSSDVMHRDYVWRDYEVALAFKKKPKGRKR
jgi:hypothetical protein